MSDAKNGFKKNACKKESWSIILPFRILKCMLLADSSLHYYNFLIIQNSNEIKMLIKIEVASGK